MNDDASQTLSTYQGLCRSTIRCWKTTPPDLFAAAQRPAHVAGICATLIIATLWAIMRFVDDYCSTCRRYIAHVTGSSPNGQLCSTKYGHLWERGIIVPRGKRALERHLSAFASPEVCLEACLPDLTIGLALLSGVGQLPIGAAWAEVGRPIRETIEPSGNANVSWAALIRLAGVRWGS